MLERYYQTWFFSLQVSLLRPTHPQILTKLVMKNMNEDSSTVPWEHLRGKNKRIPTEGKMRLCLEKGGS